MSEHSVRALLERLESDADLRRHLEEASTPDEKDQILHLAGFDVSSADIQEQLQKGELSDKDLEGVAGGGDPEIPSSAPARPYNP